MSDQNFSVDDIIKAAGEKLREDFNYLVKTNPHFGDRGTESESILMEFLNKHLPKRYSASSGFIIDNENKMSNQVDVIIYDSVNSPVFRKDEKSMILPSDNVAVAIEVKSNLNKSELEDASKKIAIVKSLKKSPITNVDQPVIMADVTITKTTGVVFAYTSILLPIKE